jgi:hypothetical protein
MPMRVWSFFAQAAALVSPSASDRSRAAHSSPDHAGHLAQVVAEELDEGVGFHGLGDRREAGDVREEDRQRLRAAPEDGLLARGEHRSHQILGHVGAERPEALLHAEERRVHLAYLAKPAVRDGLVAELEAPDLVHLVGKAAERPRDAVREPHGERDGQEEHAERDEQADHVVASNGVHEVGLRREHGDRPREVLVDGERGVAREVRPVAARERKLRRLLVALSLGPRVHALRVEPELRRLREERPGRGVVDLLGADEAALRAPPGLLDQADARVRDDDPVLRVEEHPAAGADLEGSHEVPQAVQVGVDGEDAAHRPAGVEDGRGARDARDALVEEHVRRRPGARAPLLRERPERARPRVVAVVELVPHLGEVPGVVDVVLEHLGVAVGADDAVVDAKDAGRAVECPRERARVVAEAHPAQLGVRAEGGVQHAGHVQPVVTEHALVAEAPQRLGDGHRTPQLRARHRGGLLRDLLEERAREDLHFLASAAERQERDDAARQRDQDRDHHEETDAVADSPRLRTRFHCAAASHKVPASSGGSRRSAPGAVPRHAVA